MLAEGAKRLVEPVELLTERGVGVPQREGQESDLIHFAEHLPHTCFYVSAAESLTGGTHAIPTEAGGGDDSTVRARDEEGSNATVFEAFGAALMAGLVGIAERVQQA